MPAEASIHRILCGEYLPNHRTAQKTNFVKVFCAPKFPCCLVLFIECFADFLRVRVEEFGPSTSRFSPKRINIHFEPGDKHDG